ncbi:MAG: tRNA (adenosine(37)-N6)-threonylcarbamoyltransferase complex ATPase subunit type 1 TsaE [Anaerolineae bacterium]|nr:tRNA (adenosine(37)-N6)-threonylcarbamoyltransferase complex ATPase subunit type 1 TsaE [Anaerolineae bacterium]
MPILDAHSFEFISRSPEQTRRIGIRLGSSLQAGDVICLSGELGAGKTTLVQGIAQGWGSLDAVTSPTFVLVNNYRKTGGFEMNHFDAYRVQNALEAEDLDLTGMIADGPFLVEWAERVKSVLPEDHLWVNMKYLDEEQRSLLFIPHGKRFEQMIEKLRMNILKGLE